MAKLIRICIAGTTSSGKSFLLGGIKTVFATKPLFRGINYKLGNKLSTSKITSLDQIESDINANIDGSGEGTQLITKYLCPIIDGASTVKANILFSNIPGEAFEEYLEQKEGGRNDFTSLHVAFNTFLAQNRKAKFTYEKIKSFQYKFSFLGLFGILENQMITYEKKLKTLFLQFLYERYQSVVPTTVGSMAENHFEAYLNYRISDNVIFCYNPTLKPAGRAEQTALLNLVIQNLDGKKSLNFAITKFDDCFNKPQEKYVTQNLNTSQDYFCVVRNKIQFLQQLYNKNYNKNILGNNSININNLYWDKQTCISPDKLIQELYNTGQLIIDEENGYINNLFLTSNNFTNQPINKKYFPGFSKTDTNYFTPNTYAAQRIPLGCMELILSILLKNHVIELGQLEFKQSSEYELVQNVYFN
jgi:hypothetical protein